MKRKFLIKVLLTPSFDSTISLMTAGRLERLHTYRRKQITSEIIESSVHIGWYHRGSSVFTKAQWAICAKSFTQQL